MAKKGTASSRPASSTSASASAATESTGSTSSSATIPGEHEGHATNDRLTAIAEELGRFLGRAAGKAEHLYEQRDTVVKSLAGIRDSASQLLERFGVGVAKGRNGSKKTAATSKSRRTTAKPASTKGGRKK